jgi:hypothetical protein
MTGVDFHSAKQSSLLGEGLAVVGFLAFTAAIWGGHSSPARGYEVSIYAATPPLFWIGIGTAASIGIGLSFVPGIAGRIRQLGYVLTAGSLVAVASIPAIRGYHYFGPADALTHLGWIRDMMSGQMNPLDLLYPGMHASSIVLSELSGLSITYSIELVVIVFLTVYVVFVPLVVQSMADRRWAVPVGLLFALFFVPINNVSVFRMAHPATQAILLSPVLLYFIYRYLDHSQLNARAYDHRTNASVRDLIRAPTWLDLLIVLTGLSMIFVHPQIALSIVGLMAAMSALQLLARVKRPGSALAAHPLLVGHTLVVGTGFQLWAPNHERATAASTAIIQSFLAFFTGETAPGDGIATRGLSLAELGGSVEVLFLKLFGVSLLMCVIAAFVVLRAVQRQREKRTPAEDDFVMYAAAGLLALGVGFGIYFLSSVTTQYFRQLGLIMVVVTVLAAAGVARALASVSRQVTRTSSKVTRTSSTGSARLSKLAAGGMILLLLVTLFATVPNLYRSPYMYQASDQVPAGHIDGYEAAFDRMDRDVPFMGIHNNGGRYRDAIYGFERARGGQFPGGAVPPPVFNAGNYSEHYDDSRYLAVSQRDVQRELVVLDGLRYEQRGFDHVEEHRRVNRVSSNQQVRVYYISAN